MKFAFIVIWLLAIIAQVLPALARSAAVHPEDPWNPQHIDGLPSEVRHVLARMCSSPRALHPFAGYFQNLRVLVLHFEHLRCDNGSRFCMQAGCLHQVYTLAAGRYRLVKSYYAPEGD
jgi:hypothetical protein